MKSTCHTQKSFSCDNPKKFQNGGLFFQVGESMITIFSLPTTLQIVSFLQVYYFKSVFLNFNLRKFVS